MQIKIKETYEVDIAVKEGISPKTGKPYSIPFLIIRGTPYGDFEVNVDTRTTRGGILIDIIAKGENVNG